MSYFRRDPGLTSTCGKLTGIEHLTPHGLHTTFNTLSKKGGTTLEQRQRKMGHIKS